VWTKNPDNVATNTGSFTALRFVQGDMYSKYCMIVKDINANEFRQLIDVKKNNLEIIDVRDSDEFDIIRFKYSRLIPMNDLKNRLDEINWNRLVVFVCRTGARSKYIASVVMNSRRKIINLQGGIVDFYYNFDSEDFLDIDMDKVDEYI